MAAETQTDVTSQTDAPAAAPQTAPDSVLDAAAGGGADAQESASAAPKDSAAEKPAEGEGEKSLLDEATSENGETPQKADGQTDAKKDGEPEPYGAFQLPEGVELDQATLAQATPVLRELGLNQDQAQKLVSLYAEITEQTINTLNEQQNEARRVMVAEWTNQTKAHPEFGGDKLKASAGLVLKAIDALSDSPKDAAEFKSMLKESGLGNNPHIFALLARAGSKLSEDTLVTADAAAQGAPKSAAERLWPSMYQQKQE